MAGKWTNVFDHAQFTIQGDHDTCEIIARRPGRPDFHLVVRRAEVDGASPTLVALQHLERWYVQAPAVSPSPADDRRERRDEGAA
ncbi:MAG TPA: hypothetical protein VNI83_12540 [Vicinamibacterales bacterium]|nr:hypothetical protein [Vicinamibacterales bacterium]